MSGASTSIKGWVSTYLSHYFTDSMRAIIHFSAFDQAADDDLIIKEVAVVNPDLDTLQSWILQPPFDFSDLPLTLQLDNDYLSTHIFGLQWTDGDVPYSELQRLLTTYTKHYGILYTHGRRRQQFLQRILGRSVVNLEDLHCPKSSKLVFPVKTCAHYLHQFRTFRCALQEAQCYSNYLKYYDLARYVIPEPSCVYNPTPITPSPSVDEDSDHVD